MGPHRQASASAWGQFSDYLLAVVLGSGDGRRVGATGPAGGACKRALGVDGPAVGVAGAERAGVAVAPDVLVGPGDGTSPASREGAVAAGSAVGSAVGGSASATLARTRLPTVVPVRASRAVAALSGLPWLSSKPLIAAMPSMKPRLPITSTRHPILGGLDGGLAAASRTAWTRAVGTCRRPRTTSKP